MTPGTILNTSKSSIFISLPDNLVFLCDFLGFSSLFFPFLSEITVFSLTLTRPAFVAAALLSFTPVSHLSQQHQSDCRFADNPASCGELIHGGPSFLFIPESWPSTTYFAWTPPPAELQSRNLCCWWAWSVLKQENYRDLDRRTWQQIPLGRLAYAVVS